MNEFNVKVDKVDDDDDDDEDDDDDDDEDGNDEEKKEEKKEDLQIYSATDGICYLFSAFPEKKNLFCFTCKHIMIRKSCLFRNSNKISVLRRE